MLTITVILQANANGKDELKWFLGWIVKELGWRGQAPMVKVRFTDGETRDLDLRHLFREMILHLATCDPEEIEILHPSMSDERFRAELQSAQSRMMHAPRCPSTVQHAAVGPVSWPVAQPVPWAQCQLMVAQPEQ